MCDDLSCAISFFCLKVAGRVRTQIRAHFRHAWNLQRGANDRPAGPQPQGEIAWSRTTSPRTTTSDIKRSTWHRWQTARPSISKRKNMVTSDESTHNGSTHKSCHGARVADLPARNHKAKEHGQHNKVMHNYVASQVCHPARMVDHPADQSNSNAPLH